MADVKDNGLALASCAMPEKIETSAELELLLTGIIFASSVQHAVEGNGVWDILGNPAHHPLSLRLPPPTEVCTTYARSKT